MVFPSLYFNLESGVISQCSTFIIIAFSYCLNRWKKVGLALLALVISFLFIQNSFAIMVAPGGCGTMCLSQQNFYGIPNGRGPVYPYPSIYPNYMTNNSWQIKVSPYRPMWNNNCIECNMIQQQTITPSYLPTWNNYGYRNYSNFNYPGAWGQDSLDGRYYPGQGHFAAGKPNIYFSGKKGTNVSLKLNLSKNSNLLAALPVHGQKGWNFEISQDHKLTTNKANYPYLFYDYRMSMDTLQAQKGFCLEAPALIPRLESILYQLQFHAQEVADFTEYWSVKMPKSDEYCIYPQVVTDLQKSAAYEISPTPSSVTRINFIILTKEIMGKQFLGKFSKRPSQIWTPDPSRKVAAKNEEQLEIREWGVSFWVGQ